MVTTRQGTDTPGNEATPLSSAKRRVGKRELDALDTPTVAKRQKRTTPKDKGAKKPSHANDQVIQDSEEETVDTIDVVLPSGATPSSEGKLPIRRRSSPQIIVGKLSPPAGDAGEDETATPKQASQFQTPEQPSSSVYATPFTSKKAEGSPTPRAKRATERKQLSAKKNSGRNRNTHLEVEQTTVEVVPEISDLPDEIPSSTHETEAASPSQDVPATIGSAKKAHMRFGSEEPAEFNQSIIMNAQGHKRYDAPETAQETVLDLAQPEVDDDSASDSDEAPEVVTTTAAASKALASQAEATRAQQAAQDKERQKREAREARIAQEQAEKRKREEKKAKKLARQAAKQQTATHDDDDEEEDAQSSLNIDRRNLPALLPDSLLSALPSQRAPTPPLSRPGQNEEERRLEKLNRHIKFLERSDKGPKDVKKGKLSVAVLRDQNKAVPPKANHDTRNVREHWLKGRQKDFKKGAKKNVMFGKMERRAFGNAGFLRDE